MAEERKDVADMTVTELRARASELEITGRSGMNKDELRQAVSDAEVQIAGVTGGGGPDWQADEDAATEAKAEDDAAAEPKSDAGDGQSWPEDEDAEHTPAPSIGPHTHLEKFHEAPEERLARHEQSDVDAMGLDKRRPVVGQQYGASFAKQATVYGIALAVIVGLVIGGKLAADELDQGPAVNEDKAPWSAADAQQRPPEPIDFPRNPSP
jgi:hypothetical protein